MIKNSKPILSLGLATALFIGAVVTTFGRQMQAAPVKQPTTATTGATTSTAHKRRQRRAAHRRHLRHPAHTLKASAKKRKLVPKAKSLSKESY